MAADRPKTAPPNLRPSKGYNACGNCEHFVAELLKAGRCRLFDHSVQATQVCDRYKPRKNAAGKR